MTRYCIKLNAKRSVIMQSSSNTFVYERALELVMYIGHRYYTLRHQACSVLRVLCHVSAIVLLPITTVAVDLNSWFTLFWRNFIVDNCSIIKVYKKLSYCKVTVRFLHYIEIRVLH